MNADQFVKKRDDLCMLIAGDEPDFMLVNEVIPKAQVFPISPALLSIPHNIFPICYVFKL